MHGSQRVLVEHLPVAFLPKERDCHRIYLALLRSLSSCEHGFANVTENLRAYTEIRKQGAACDEAEGNEASASS